MSKRNMIWLGVVVAAGVLVGIAAGPWWGVLAAALVLLASEAVERTSRRRRAERDGTTVPSIRNVFTRRRSR